MAAICPEGESYNYRGQSAGSCGIFYFMHLKKGYIHCYTGNGKGKTTAAFGLALRAAGAGLSIFIAQFAKGRETSEVKFLSRISGQVTLRQFGTGTFIRKPSAKDRLLAEQGLAAVEAAIVSGRYDLVVLDEICGVCHAGIASAEKVAGIITAKPAHVEIVVTGRKAPKKLLQIADLITEMKEIKHYYKSGVKARKGIEY